MTSLKEKLASLPADRRAAVKARAKTLALEGTTLRATREAVGGKQAAVAKQMGIGQDSVSRLEKRGDMLVSTLRDYVEALGGKVRLVVEFDGQPAVELTKIGVKRAVPKGRQTRASRAA